MPQQDSLLAEIRTAQKALAATRTVSSMGDELKVSFGSFDGSKNGWVSYISLYSDSILIYSDSFIVKYEALSGKRQPTEAELEDLATADEYDSNIDMYNSLLTRGAPILYFEIDYNVAAEGDDKPSQYKFNFSKIRVINTVSGKITQTSALNKVQPRTMKPEWDLREKAGIVAKEKTEFEALNKYISKGLTLKSAKEAVINAMFDELGIKMVNIPEKNYLMLYTEVTQKLYTSIVGSNPSKFKGDSNPVENVSWYDAIYFCNKLSKKFGYTPVYSVKGKWYTNPDEWKYTPHKGKRLDGVEMNEYANGFRLPTEEEWQYAVRGGRNYTYAGSDYLREVGWYRENSEKKTHPVAQKKANGYGLYDMSGNVWEWCWDADHSGKRYICGGSYYNDDSSCKVDGRNDRYADDQFDAIIGFRIVRNRY